MTNENKKLLKKQLDEAYKFQSNTKIIWVHRIANGLVDMLKNMLNNNLDDFVLSIDEGYIQQTCDIFSGYNHYKYDNKICYSLILAKYDEKQEPFNHVWKIHSLVDLIVNE